MPTIDLDRARARLVVERERLQRELAEVRGERTTDVDDGSYGYDEETGEPIDPVRLEAVPTARTNIR